MKINMKKLVAVLSAASIVLTLVSVPVSAKKKTVVTPRPKIVSLKYSTYNNMKAAKQTIKISWNAVKTTGRVDILNAKKNVVKSKLWQKRITKKGSASVSWNGCSSNGANVANGTYYVKFTLGKKSVTKKFTVKSVTGLMTFKNVTMQCPAGYKLTFDQKVGFLMFESQYPSNKNMDLFGMEMANIVAVDEILELFSANSVDDKGKGPVSKEITDVSIQVVAGKKAVLQFETSYQVYYLFAYKNNSYIFGFNYNHVNEEGAVADIQQCIDSIVLK